MSTPHKIRVLYIEDNFSNRMLVRRVLEAEGRYEVLEAEDGMSGILKAQQEAPNLILVDISIPGLDGYEVATRLKSFDSLRDVPIVALTGRTLRGDRERALSAGCDGYIQKPINIESFPLELQEFLKGKRETMEVAEERQYLREHSQRFVERLEVKIAELTKVNEDLRENDRLKSKFIVLAAHELRTPLTIIQGYFGILLDHVKGQPGLNTQEVQTTLAGVEKGVRRLHTIINDMLDVARLEAGTMELHPTQVSVGEIVGTVLHDLQAVVQERGQQVSLVALDKLPKIWADNQRLYQVFINLVGNAIKYTPDGGQIRISGTPISASIAPSPKLPITNLSTDYVDVVVQDSGVGIAATDMERIFQRFYEVQDDSLHSSSKHSFLGGGMGLGLAIARGIVEAHGGRLWAESEGYDLERCPGSRFHVLIPVHRVQKSQVSGAKDSPQDLGEGQ